MDKKKRVLIVTNAITDDEVIQIKKAFQAELAANDNRGLDIKLSLVHAIPSLPVCYFNIPSMGMLIEKYYDEAKESLTQVGKYLNIPQKDQWLISGKVRTEVLRLANKLGSDFILASAHEIQELQRSLFFKNIRQYSMVRNINQLKTL